MTNNTTIDPEVMSDYELMRSKKGHKYSIYSVREENGSKVISMEKVVKGDDPTSSHEIKTLLEDDLPQNTCRFIMFDFRVITHQDSQIDKLVLFIW